MLGAEQTRGAGDGPPFAVGKFWVAALPLQALRVKIPPFFLILRRIVADTVGDSGRMLT